MLGATVPLMTLMAVWVAISRRRGAVVVTVSRFGEVRDSGCFCRGDAPAQFWTAIAATAGLGLLCLGLSVAAVRPGVAW